VLGRSCRFLQGPATSRDSVAALRAGIAAAVPVTSRLLNYRRDGTPFWNSVHVTPVRDASGAVVLFVGVQIDVTAEVDAEHAAEMAAADAAAFGDEAEAGGGGGAGADGNGGDSVGPLPSGGVLSPPRGVPSGVAQMGAVGAVRVAVRGLKSDALKRHNSH
jgi:hypothetical protein